MHRFRNMIFCFLTSYILQKICLVKNVCAQKNTNKGKYDFLVVKSGKSMSFAWKVGKMCGRTCVVLTSSKIIPRTHFAHMF